MLDLLQCKYWAFDIQYWNRLSPYVMNAIENNDFSKIKSFDFRKRHTDIEGKIQSSAYMYYVSVDNQKTSTPLQQNSTAILEMVGVVTKYGGFCSYGTKDYINQIQSALDDPNVDSIILYIDSPGGSVDGTEELANFINTAKKQKPIIAYADGLMASAAYWVGSQADYIFANSSNTCWVGSIGTLIMHIDQSARLEKEGLKVTYLTADKSTQKVLGNSAEPLSEDAITSFKGDLNAINDTFIKGVKNGRVSKLDNQTDIFTGATFRGQDAKKYGLIDEIGTLEQAITKARKMAKIKQVSTK